MLKEVSAYSVKRSFSIKNIQNPLQRHYRKGQTVLPFEQNVLEDTDKIKKKIFRENHQKNYKRQYGSNCAVL